MFFIQKNATSKHLYLKHVQIYFQNFTCQNVQERVFKLSDINNIDLSTRNEPLANIDWDCIERGTMKHSTKDFKSDIVCDSLSWLIQPAKGFYKFKFSSLLLLHQLIVQCNLFIQYALLLDFYFSMVPAIW